LTAEFIVTSTVKLDLIVGEISQRHLPQPGLEKPSFLKVKFVYF